MTKLYSYVVDTDDGAAPNPFWGVCTLAICKPAIRRTAKIGDWVVGTGGKNSPMGDIRGRVIYAMKITDVLTMQQYDAETRNGRLPANKIPDWNNPDTRRRLGDSIYDFSNLKRKRPNQRCGVHDETCIARDLSGKNVLISEHFFYFGGKPILLPDDIIGICKTGQGHRVHVNKGYIPPFLKWISDLGSPSNFEAGKPSRDIFNSKNLGSCDSRGLSLHTEPRCSPKNLIHKRRKPLGKC